MLDLVLRMAHREERLVKGKACYVLFLLHKNYIFHHTKVLLDKPDDFCHIYFAQREKITQE